MPRPKPIESYPRAYFELFRRAGLGERIEMTSFHSYDSARAFRAHLYTFRKVLRGHAENPEYAALLQLAERVKCVIDGTKLIVEPRRVYGERILQEALNDNRVSTERGT